MSPPLTERNIRAQAEPFLRGQGYEKAIRFLAVDGGPWTVDHGRSISA